MRSIQLLGIIWCIPAFLTLYWKPCVAEQDYYYADEDIHRQVVPDYEDRFEERNYRYSDHDDTRNSRPRRDREEDIERIAVKMKHRRKILKRRLEEVDIMFKNHESGHHVMDTETKTHMERQHSRILQQVNDLEYVDNYKDSRYRRVSAKIYRYFPFDLIILLIFIFHTPLNNIIHRCVSIHSYTILSQCDSY